MSWEMAICILAVLLAIWRIGSDTASLMMRSQEHREIQDLLRYAQREQDRYAQRAERQAERQAERDPAVHHDAAPEVPTNAQIEDQRIDRILENIENYGTAKPQKKVE